MRNFRSVLAKVAEEFGEVLFEKVKLDCFQGEVHFFAAFDSLFGRRKSQAFSFRVMLVAFAASCLEHSVLESKPLANGLDEVLIVRLRFRNDEKRYFVA